MYKAILIFHVLCGTICLLSGAIAIFSRKGGRLHTRVGRVFYFLMYAVGASALLMTLMKFNPFLLSIAIFSVYMSYSGKKALFYWRLKEPYVPSFTDKLPCYIAFITALFMIGYPIADMIHDKVFFVPVLAVFGTILLSLSLRDIKVHSRPEKFRPRNREWLFMHIGKMSGAYISAFTAFLLNNIHFDPFWVPWLAPTAVGLPLIFLAISRWNKKLNIGKVANAVA